MSSDNALANLANLLASKPSPPKPKCLYIGPMKGEDSATRERFDAVYEEIVKPAAKSVGMDAETALADSPGMITSGIFRQIRHAQVIVADMTGDNTCVGYELAFAHSLARCTVLVIKDGYRIPFDLRDMNHIKFDHEDPGAMRTARNELVAQLRKCSEMGWVSANNPIFHAAYAPPEAARLDPPVNSLAALGSAKTLADLILPAPKFDR